MSERCDVTYRCNSNGKVFTAVLLLSKKEVSAYIDTINTPNNPSGFTYLSHRWSVL